MAKSNFSHAATILPVSNMEASIPFYVELLGFSLEFTWNDPVDYAVLKQGGVSIHLSKKMDDYTPSKNHVALYIFVHDVEKVYNDFRSRKVPIKSGLAHQEYHMREFDIIDPDGHIISLGQGH